MIAIAAGLSLLALWAGIWLGHRVGKAHYHHRVKLLQAGLDIANNRVKELETHD